MSPGWGVEGVSVRRGTKAILEGVSVGFVRARVTSLVGPNGSGKTTLLRVLVGLERPTEGTVVGAEASWREPQWSRAVACVVGVTTDLPFCVEEVLLSSQFAEGGRWLDPSEARRRPLLELLERLEVFSEGARKGLDREYASLSAGERQLVDVTRAVLQATPVLVLDEPTSALDVRHRLLVQELLADEARRGRTVVVSLHDLDHLPEGDVAVLHRGRLVALGGRAVLDDGLLAQVWGVVRRGDDYRLG